MRKLALLLAALGALAGWLASSPASPPWRPRVVVLVALDTCRADHLGCYGYGRNTTPNLDRLAAGGVLFERAYSQANESLFSYGSIFTGRYPQRIGRLTYEDFLLTPEVPTLAEELRASGFRTGGFVAGGHLRHEFGFDQGFELYRDEAHFGSLFHTLPPAEAWLESLPERSRAFMVVHGYDAHVPYRTLACFNHLFAPGYAGPADRLVRTDAAAENIYLDTFYPDLPSQKAFYRGVRGVDHMSPSIFDVLRERRSRQEPGEPVSRGDLEHLVAHYDACVAYADVLVGRLVARLGELGLEREALVVVLGDHGEDLMDHGFFNHRVGVHDSSLHVPLLIWGPGGIPAGRRVRQVVELVDVAPTILDYAGLSGAGGDGRSLRPLVEGAGESPGRAFAEGIRAGTTVRSPEGRLVSRFSSREPLPALKPGSFTFYRDVEGREVEAPLDSPQAGALWTALRDWTRSLAGEPPYARRPGQGPGPVRTSGDARN